MNQTSSLCQPSETGGADPGTSQTKVSWNGILILMSMNQSDLAAERTGPHL